MFGCFSMWGKMRLSKKEAFIGLVCILLISRFLSLFLPLSDCGIAGRHVRMIFVNINIFLLGVAFARFDIFKSLDQYTKGLFARKWVVALFLTLPIVSRAYLPMKGVTELITVPVFCVGIINLCKYSGGDILRYLGKHSMNMWLIHSVFIYYYLREVAFIIQSPIVMYLIVVGCSLLASTLIETLKEYFTNKLCRNLLANKS